MKEEYLTLNDLSRIFRTSVATLRKRMAEGVITPRKRTRRGYVFAKSDINKLKRRDVARKFNFSTGYRRDVELPTSEELELLETYIREGNVKNKLSKKLGISRQRLSQKMASIAYRRLFSETLEGEKQ